MGNRGLGHLGVPEPCSREMAQDFDVEQGLFRNKISSTNAISRCSSSKLASREVKLHWVSALLAKSPMLHLWFGEFCIWYNGTGTFGIIFLRRKGLVPEQFFGFRRKPWCTGTFYSNIESVFQAKIQLALVTADWEESSASLQNPFWLVLYPVLSVT